MIPQFPHLTKAEISEIQKLQRKKHRLENKALFIEGSRLCHEALHANWPIQKIICTARFLESETASLILDAVESNKPPVFLTSERDFKKISNTAHAQGIGALLRFPQQALNADSLLNEKKGIVIAIDELNDPGNLGTIIRTAEWFGVTGMAIGKNTVAWHNDKVLRASMGAIFHLPFLEVEDFPMFLQKAKAAGFTLFAADQNGTTSLSNVQIPEKSILLLGDEAKGLSRQSRKAADEILAIEGKGKVESLNVASAAAILMAKFCEPGRS